MTDDPCRALEVGAREQGLDALMDVAEPLLKADHGLAVAGEAEAAGLDDAGVDRANRDLVQALALDRQEEVGRLRLLPARRPTPVVEPGAVVGRVLGGEAVQVADCALRP